MAGQVAQLRRDMLRLAATDPDALGGLLVDLVQRVEALEARSASPPAPVPTPTLLPQSITVAAPKPQVPLSMPQAQRAARQAAHDQWRAMHPLTKVLRVVVTSCRARTWGGKSGATLYHVEGYVRTVMGRSPWGADVSPQDGSVVGVQIKA